MAEVDNKGDAAAVGEKEEVQETASEQVQEVSNGDAATENTKDEPEKADNIKPEDMEVVKAKIVKQVEYYFGDMNLLRDRFLKEQIQLDDGWITQERMLKFNRLKSISSDWSVIRDALRESSELMEVNEDGDKVRRKPSKPLPADSKERRDEITARSIYAKRFPLECKLDDLLPFFESYGPVENIFLKRDFHKHTFKGSVFVTFESKEVAEKFLAEEDTKFKDTALEMKEWKSDYFKKKPQARKDAAAAKRAEKQKNSNDGNKPEATDKPGAKPEVDAEDEDKVREQMTRGAVLHISGMNQETEREEVRALFLEHGDVSWVDFDKGVTEGYIRLKEGNSAHRCLESLNKIEGGIILHGANVHVRVVDGDEELQYWQKMYRDIAERKKAKREGLVKHRAGRDRNFRGRRGGRGGYRGGYLGKRDRANDEDGAPPAKKNLQEY